MRLQKNITAKSPSVRNISRYRNFYPNFGFELDLPISLRWPKLPSVMFVARLGADVDVNRHALALIKHGHEHA